MKRMLAVPLLLAVGAMEAVHAEDPVSTAWAEPIDGTWLEAGRWSNGIPSAGSVADIVVPGDYRVTMEYLVTDVPSMTTVGGGAVLDIACGVSTWPYPVTLLEGGRLRISGKSRMSPPALTQLAFRGGVLEYTAAGITNTWGETSTALTNVSIRMAGAARTGIGVGNVEAKGLELSLVSTNDEGVSSLVLADNAKLWANDVVLNLGTCGQKGLSRLGFETGRSTSDDWLEGSALSLTVGYEGGTGVVEQASGRLVFSQGVTLGGLGGEWFDQSQESRVFNPVGVYEQSGGLLRVEGAAIATADRPTGVLIGDGSRSGSAAASAFSGVWRLSGGELDCRRAYLMIGLGKGEGLLEQSGGTVRQNFRTTTGYMAPTVLGWKGGSGVWRFTGSAKTDFGAESSLYLGGMEDSRLAKAFGWITLYSISSKGTLVIGDGAVFKAPPLTVLGESGQGFIEIGSAGRFEGGALTVTPGSPSELRFTAGEAGFGSVKLEGAFAADSAVRIHVDFAGLAPVGKATLIEAGSITGLESFNVVLENVPPERETEVTIDGTSLVVGLKSGSLVIVR